MSIIRPIERNQNKSPEAHLSCVDSTSDIASRPEASKVAMRILAKSLVRDLRSQGYAQRDIVALSSELIGLAADSLAAL